MWEEVENKQVVLPYSTDTVNKKRITKHKLIINMTQHYQVNTDNLSAFLGQTPVTNPGPPPVSPVTSGPASPGYPRVSTANFWAFLPATSGQTPWQTPWSPPSVSPVTSWPSCLNSPGNHHDKPSNSLALPRSPVGQTPDKPGVSSFSPR